jgi:hypothetical protein
MQLRRYCTVGLISAISFAASAQTSTEQSLVSSFRAFSSDFLQSLRQKEGCHTKQASADIPDSWFKECQKYDVDSAKIDVTKTASLVSPYVGTLVVRVVISNTVWQPTEAKASADTVITHIREQTVEYSFGYQSGKWRFTSSRVISETE